jgi:dolichol-phosphate mannosyltransferase
MSDQLRTRNVHIQQHASPLQRRGLARGLAMALITPAETGTLDATHAAQADVRVSVVIPAHDEAENLPGLIAEIEAALAGVEHEVIVVDDGSHDHTGATLAAISQSTPALRMVRHARAGGQSAAVRSGLLVARGSIVVTLDGDGLAAGQRVGRKDGTAKTIASRFANSLRGALLRDGTRDSGCGLKAIRRHVFLLLPFFDGWHRFLPALVIREGYAVVHVDVVDRPRRFGRSKYGILDRGMRGALDLFGVWWLIRRSRRVEISSDTDV